MQRDASSVFSSKIIRAWSAWTLHIFYTQTLIHSNIFITKLRVFDKRSPILVVKGYALKGDVSTSPERTQLRRSSKQHKPRPIWSKQINWSIPGLILIGSNFTIRQFWLSVPAQTGLTWSDFRQIAPLGAATRDCAKWREPWRQTGGGEREWTEPGAYLHWRQIEFWSCRIHEAHHHTHIHTFHI